MSEVIEQLRAVIKPEGSWYTGTWYEGHKDGDFECVDTVDNGYGRWYRYEAVIVKHAPTGDHYAFNQDVGLTESQDSAVHADKIWLVVKQTKVVETVLWVKP